MVVTIFNCMCIIYIETSKTGRIINSKTGANAASDIPDNRRSLVRTPYCKKYPLGRDHTSIALEVVAHFGPPFYYQKNGT